MWLLSMKTTDLKEIVLSFLPSGLRAKVLLGVVIPLLIILGAFTLIEYFRRQEIILDSLSILATHSGQVVEANLRQAMLDDNFAEVQTLLDAIGNTGQFRVVYLLDLTGEVIFAPHEEGIGVQLNNQQPDCIACHALTTQERPQSIVVTAEDGQRVFRNMYPIVNRAECNECHEPDNRLLGLLLTDIPTAPMESALHADLRENLLWWAGTILMTVLVVNLVLNRFVLRRLERLAAAIAGLGDGQGYPVLPEEQPDEIGQLGITFNLMARQVETRQRENDLLSDSLRRQNAQRGELLKRFITAQEGERKRVARELHDELGQSLSGLALRAKILERHIDSGANGAQEQLNAIHDLVQDTTDRMYNLILDLRPSVLDDLGLAAALRVYAGRLLAETDIIFELDASGLSERLPPPVETALYRVFQETLSNVARHAQATRVLVSLNIHDRSFEGVISDNGCGFDLEHVPLDGQSPRGMGLLGMRERVAQCSGQLDIVSQPGSGTRVVVRIPLTGGAHYD